MNPDTLYDVSTAERMDKPIKLLDFQFPCEGVFQDGELKLVERAEESVETAKDVYRSSNTTAMESESSIYYHGNLFYGAISLISECAPFLVNVEALARTRAAKLSARTPLELRLLEIRERIVASGQTLFGWEDIEREIADRRGRIE
jgi:hypothetical protein